MSGNSFGKLFSVTTFGESHGPAIGCVIDGCPPGLALSEADIQPELDRRKPGTSRHVTQRQYLDRVGFLALRHVARSARFAAVQLRLDIGFRQDQARRAAVDHAADGRTMRFAESGNSKQLAK